MFTVNIEYFKSKPVNIKKTTILLDHGYHIDYLVRELQKVYPGIMTKIRFERSNPHSALLEGQKLITDLSPEQDSSVDKQS